jgi:hypothetical protein
MHQIRGSETETSGPHTNALDEAQIADRYTAGQRVKNSDQRREIQGMRHSGGLYTETVFEAKFKHEMRPDVDRNNRVEREIGSVTGDQRADTQR